MLPNAFLDQTIILMVWWSVWTAADRYLIPFTPVSEIGVLMGAGAMVLVRARWASASAGCTRVISEVTHTPAPVDVKTAEAYSRQVDAV